MKSGSSDQRVNKAGWKGKPKRKEFGPEPRLGHHDRGFVVLAYPGNWEAGPNACCQIGLIVYCSNDLRQTCRLLPKHYPYYSAATPNGYMVLGNPQPELSIIGSDFEASWLLIRLPRDPPQQKEPRRLVRGNAVLEWSVGIEQHYDGKRFKIPSISVLVSE